MSKDTGSGVKLTTLGSMGWIPVRDRQTCCYCLETGGCDTLLVFDAGTGLARFAEPWGREILEKHNTVLLLLSHYHLDHVSGLIYLSHFFKHKKVHLAAPGKEIYGKSAREILDGFISPPFFGRPLDRWSLDIRIHDLGTGEQTIAGIEVETIRQEHSDPSLGIKINDKSGSVCYITDTACGEETAQFASGARLLLHETWLDNTDYERLDREARETGETPPLLSSHSPVRQVAQIAAKAGVEELLLIHLNPSYDEARFISMETDARRIFPAARLARDGQILQV